MPLPQMPDDNNNWIVTENHGAEIARLIYQTRLFLQCQKEVFPNGIHISTVHRFLDATYGPQNWDHVQEQLLWDFLNTTSNNNINLSDVHRVLDIACGPGAWALEVASTYPDMEVVGVDISPTMIEHANLFAKVEEVTNVDFRTMNVLKGIDFPDECFDLVNANFIYAFMDPCAWTTLLQECKRILRIGGIMKLTELEGGVTNSRAVESNYEIWVQAQKESGRSFSPDGRHLGITAVLKGLLRNTGFQDVKHKAYALDCSYGSEFNHAFLENLVTFSRNIETFISQYKSEAISLTFKRQVEQAIEDISSHDFRGIIYFLSSWGSRSAIKEIF